MRIITKEDVSGFLVEAYRARSVSCPACGPCVIEGWPTVATHCVCGEPYAEAPRPLGTLTVTGIDRTGE